MDSEDLLPYSQGHVPSPIASQFSIPFLKLHCNPVHYASAFSTCV